MRTASLPLFIAGLGVLSGCGGGAAAPEAAARAPVVTDWRRLATPADRRRLGEWRTAFIDALAAARADGHGAEIDREGALLMPDAALDQVDLPAGNYRCRVIKLGTQVKGRLSYVAYPTFGCRAAATPGGFRMEKLSGSQRPAGYAYPDGPRRMVFLGSMALGDETMAMDYGYHPDRDVAAAVERIGPGRWRLVVPYPRFESVLDVVELVPAPAN
ncbi:hypothetical protein FHS96_002474 [Sphingomonas zeicaulis]|uniref:DUF4893 domain-containing protein n=1 Tax=Sphingomonas zeicaulis TaxID=1632740 RepID=UPI003D233627